MTEHIFGFQQQLKMSHGVSLSFDFRYVLLTEIPNAIGIRRADEADDRTGTDWWVDRHNNNRPLSIDLKARTKDHGKDDLALETWSVVEREIVGWTRNAMKASDYILWFWNDTKRWCLIPFPMLCRVFSIVWQEWAEAYETATQATEKNGEVYYHSECVFVPREVVWAALIEHYSYSLSRIRQ